MDNLKGGGGARGVKGGSPLTDGVHRQLIAVVDSLFEDTGVDGEGLVGGQGVG